MPEQDPEQKMLLYFADPMCSWCWGFSPVITALAERMSDDVPIQLIMGGLRAGNTEVMAQKDKDYIRNHWTHVKEATGQPFNFDFFEREGFVYDTEPACRAVVAARSFDTELGLRMLARVHEAFYVEGQDTTDRDTLVALAGHEGLDSEQYGERYDSRDAEMITKIDFEITQQVGVTGYPTLLAGTGKDGFSIVAQGYQPLEAIEGPIADWAAKS